MCDSPFISSGIPELQRVSGVPSITPPGHLKVPQPLLFGVTSDFRGWGRGPWGLGGLMFRIICLHEIPRRLSTTIHREVPGHPSTPGHCVSGSHPETLQGHTLSSCPRLPAALFTWFPGFCLSLPAACSPQLSQHRGSAVSPVGSTYLLYLLYLSKAFLKLKNKN